MDDTRTRPADAQSLDATLGLLRDPRRRHVVAVLAQRNSPIGLRELAAAVAAREAGSGSDATLGDLTPDDAIDEVVATLHHVHVPKLADAGVLAYDVEAQTVTPIRTAELSSLVPTTGDSDL